MQNFPDSSSETLPNEAETPSVAASSPPHAEKPLAESEKGFRHLGERLMHQVWSAFPDGKLDYVNRLTVEYFGRTSERLLGEGWQDAVHPEDLQICVERWIASLRTGFYYETEFRLRRADGVYRWHLARANSERDADGRIIKWFGTSTDIDDQKRAEAALRESEEQFRSIVETTSEWIWAVDSEGKSFYSNPAVERILGYTPEEILGETFYPFMHEDERDKIERRISVFIAEKRGWADLVCRWRHKDGSIRYLESNAVPILGKDGSLTGFRGADRDVTARRLAEDAVQASQKRYEQLFNSNPLPIWVYDLETLRFLAVNCETVKHYGYTREEFFEMTIEDIRPAEDVELLREYVREAARIKTDLTRVVRHRKKNGAIIDIEVSTQPIEFGGRAARLVLATDITERKRTDAALRESESKFRMLVESTNEGLLQVNLDDCIQFVNNRLCEMVGYAEEELLETNWTRLLLDEGARDFINQVNERRRRGISDRYEIRLRKKNGDALWVIVGGAPITDADGAITGSLGVFTDITERKRAEEQLQHDAFHDNLTGLANRSLFMDYLRLTIERGKSRHSNMYAVLFLDFDRFKVINDSLGHAEGDKLLKLIARRLETCTRTGDLVARLGGDEFVILLSELVEEDDAQHVAERIQESLRTPFDLSGNEIFTTASIGIALSTAKHARAEDMLRDADIAMYRAKAKGKAQHQIFDSEMHKDALSQLQFETDMRHALERGEFCIFYQPIYSLTTMRLVGFEALLRWRHPKRGLISPAEFIPLAEENGLIIRLGRWTVYESCRQMREWQKKYFEAVANLTVAVNLSCKEFLQTDLAEQVNASLVSTGLDARSLKLEITESHIMENQAMAIKIMQRLRALGIELSLDDFGTGYSSLSYLHRLPVSYLKIDRSFVNGIQDGIENAEIVYTIVKLAQNLKMKVVAEGIETERQLAHLRAINCEYGQGYFLSKPLEAEAAEALVKETRADASFFADQPILDLDLNA